MNKEVKMPISFKIKEFNTQKPKQEIHEMLAKNAIIMYEGYSAVPFMIQWLLLRIKVY